LILAQLKSAAVASRKLLPQPPKCFAGDVIGYLGVNLHRYGDLAVAQYPHWTKPTLMYQSFEVTCTATYRLRSREPQASHRCKRGALKCGRAGEDRPQHHGWLSRLA
jgi:hypothetical protein